MRHALIVALTLGSTQIAGAQTINACWPPGAAPGAKAELRVEGGGFQGANRVLVSGTGVKATLGAVAGDGSNAAITLEIDSGARPGAREVRLITPRGMSSPGYFWIDPLPQSAEAEPNNQLEKATKLDKLPTAVAGRMDGNEDVDWYAFQANAGENHVIDIQANRLYSMMDANLELRDPKNRIVALAMEGYDRDPRILFLAKETGTYRLQVHDVMYRGGQNYPYRLVIGALPVVTSLTPSGGRRGEKLSAKVEGINLQGMTSLELDLSKDLPEFRPAYSSAVSPSGPVLPFAVIADDEPQVTEVDGSSPVKPMVLPPLPVTLSGRLMTAREVDTIQFEGTAGAPIQIEMRARNVGSRLHPILKITDLGGKELANSDDQIGSDPRLSFTPPATGGYRIQVSGLENKGGAEYFYRLTLRPPGKPDFRLAATPDVSSLAQGDTIKLDVSVSRQGGFSGPVEVTLEGAPAGSQVSPLTIQVGQSTGYLTITAPSGTAVAVGMLRVAGKSRVGEADMIREAEPVGVLPRAGDGAPTPRPVSFQAMAVIPDAPLYTLAAENPVFEIQRGQTISVKIKVARKPNDNNANPVIKLSVVGLPPGVRAETPDVPEKGAEQTIKLIADGDVPAGVWNVVVVGNLNNQIKVTPALRVTGKPK